MGTRIYFRRFWDARDLPWTRAWTPVPLVGNPFGTGVPQFWSYKRDAIDLTAPAIPRARPYALASFRTRMTVPMPQPSVAAVFLIPMPCSRDCRMAAWVASSTLGRPRVLP
jgi:hypothetical protein